MAKSMCDKTLYKISLSLLFISDYYIIFFNLFDDFCVLTQNFGSELGPPIQGIIGIIVLILNGSTKHVAQVS